MKGQIDINRHNWRAHCKEPPLTDDEWQRWEAVAERIRTDRTFAAAVFETTEAEFEADVSDMPDAGWAGLAHWADASRRYKRAVIEVGEKLNEKSKSQN